MGHFIQVLFFVIIATALLWFGYTLFFGAGSGARTGAYRKRRGRRPGGESFPGAPQTCPVCSAKLNEGELVKSSAFPSLNGGKDRFMHIRGCVYCLHGDRARVCPVCGRVLKDDEILVARMFERPRRRSHVHVLGCSHCRGTGKRPSR
ncbi:MAG: hypothetical protein LBS48_04165 [Treponema sp.]|jgi:hypothetical protein|nr:hypothetical protein [Treponema sp.]